MKYEVAKRVDGNYNLWVFQKDPTIAEMDEKLLMDENGTLYIPSRWVINGVYEHEYQANNAGIALNSHNKPISGTKS